ncbi:hypothetical protein HpBT060_15190 [Helicobacter pylori]
MEVIEQDLGKAYYQKLLDIRELPIGDSVFFLIIEAKKEIKNEMGQIFFINNGLETPLDKARDFAELKKLSKKAFFFNNTLFNNAFANNVIKEGDLIKITKKANVGDVVQQKHGKKKINYFDYKVTICNKSLTMEQLTELIEHYESPESDYLELAVNEDEVWDELKDGFIPL